MTTRTISDSATVVAAGDLLASEFGDELVILDLRDGVYYGLEDAGAQIWSLLQKPVSVAEIREALVAAYEVEPARCEQDVRALLAELETRGLVIVTNG
ncbi:MAG TPA: PqqD family peptide modification chaperone [Vicinamibacterales bacterium]|nr:PqqD family peptide modification chaperone [Vicinamibacterales bacterium]